MKKKYIKDLPPADTAFGPTSSFIFWMDIQRGIEASKTGASLKRHVIKTEEKKNEK